MFRYKRKLRLLLISLLCLTIPLLILYPLISYTYCDRHKFLAKTFDDYSTSTDFDVFPSFLDLTLNGTQHWSNKWQQVETRFVNLRQFYNVSVPNSEKLCLNAKVFVFVVCKSDAFEQRNAIRKSWMVAKTDKVISRFIVGRPEKSSHLLTLYDEQNQHGDMIFYDMDDTYKKLYLKTHAAFHWHQSFCPQAKFVLKIDADTVVDLQRLLFWIEKKFEPVRRRHPAVIFGSMHYGVSPDRNISYKNHVTHEEYFPSFYPPYMSGPSYLLSSQAISILLENTYRVHTLPEDVLYTGILAYLSGIRLQDEWRHFQTWNGFSAYLGCDSDGTPLQTIAPASELKSQLCDTSVKLNLTKPLV
ncbi:galactosyltransferase domain-containing protein [Ditylenchus destructor]|nr:galactosyltransferase domain-containing protein [Ditylenchus destructor]